jgi:hypothetical protein
LPVVGSLLSSSESSEASALLVALSDGSSGMTSHPQADDRTEARMREVVLTGLVMAWISEHWVSAALPSVA